MKKRDTYMRALLPSITIVCFLLVWSNAAFAQQQVVSEQNVENLLLKDYRPVSVFNIPQTRVEKAKYLVVDMHSHNYARSKEDVKRWVESMDAAGIEVSNILNNSSGEAFEIMLEKYSDYKDRFAVWCSFDYTDFDQPDWEKRALELLVRYHKMGAVGVGEVGDKGLGDLYAFPTKGHDVHLDHPRMKVLLEKCAELNMPVSVHIADPIWMYLPVDKTNDGLMNALRWLVDTTAQNCLGYNALITSFENAVAANPKTKFIACHYLNMNHDLPRLSELMDKYPNLYLDIAGRVSEAGATPRATRDFIIRYADRIVFGTDNGMGVEMYRTVFRSLETNDEHIITPGNSYYWPLSGLFLPDDVLKKIYRDNANKLIKK